MSIGPNQRKARIKTDRSIIELRGRSSFQSPAHQTLLMVKAVMDGRILARCIDGFRRVQLLRRSTGAEVEFVTIMELRFP